jgi:hypothetical protein
MHSVSFPPFLSILIIRETCDTCDFCDTCDTCDTYDTFKKWTVFGEMTHCALTHRDDLCGAKHFWIASELFVVVLNDILDLATGWGEFLGGPADHLLAKYANGYTIRLLLLL